MTTVYEPYDNLRVTTMVLLATLSGEINIVSAAHLLPLVSKEEIGIVEECLPHCSSGSILDIREKDSHRGWEPNPEPPFKNTITVDISVERKNVCLKLSPNSIHICGAKSIQDAEEACSYITEYLHYIDEIQKNKEKYEKEIEWVLEKSKGKFRNFSNIKSIKVKNVTFNVTEVLQELDINHVIPEIPEDLNKTFISYAFSLFADKQWYRDAVGCIEKIKTSNPIMNNTSVEIVVVEEVMVNHNYKLGFRINREMLNMLVDGVHGFVSHCDTSLNNHVTIELEYKPSKNSYIKRRVNKIPHHTILVYRTGSVTQTGPSRALMKEVYENFISIILEIKDHIKEEADN